MLVEQKTTMLVEQKKTLPVEYKETILVEYKVTMQVKQKTPGIRHPMQQSGIRDTVHYDEVRK